MTTKKTNTQLYKEISQFFNNNIEYFTDKKAEAEADEIEKNLTEDEREYLELNEKELCELDRDYNTFLSNCEAQAVDDTITDVFNEKYIAYLEKMIKVQEDLSKRNIINYNSSNAYENNLQPLEYCLYTVAESIRKSLYNDVFYDGTSYTIMLPEIKQFLKYFNDTDTDAYYEDEAFDALTPDDIDDDDKDQHEMLQKDWHELNYNVCANAFTNELNNNNN